MQIPPAFLFFVQEFVHHTPYLARPTMKLSARADGENAADRGDLTEFPAALMGHDGEEKSAQISCTSSLYAFPQLSDRKSVV